MHFADNYSLHSYGRMINDRRLNRPGFPGGSFP